jgi:hypothetical protein
MIHKIWRKFTESQKDEIMRWINDDIINYHFKDLPIWVNKDLFYEDMREDILHCLYYHLKQENNNILDLCYVITAPLISDYFSHEDGDQLQMNDSVDYNIQFILDFLRYNQDSNAINDL